MHPLCAELILSAARHHLHPHHSTPLGGGPAAGAAGSPWAAGPPPVILARVTQIDGCRVSCDTLRRCPQLAPLLPVGSHMQWVEVDLGLGAPPPPPPPPARASVAVEPPAGAAGTPAGALALPVELAASTGSCERGASGAAAGAAAAGPLSPAAGAAGAPFGRLLRAFSSAPPATLQALDEPGSMYDL
jgi:hypothetical protein